MQDEVQRRAQQIRAGRAKIQEEEALQAAEIQKKERARDQSWQAVRGGILDQLSNSPVAMASVGIEREAFVIYVREADRISRHQILSIEVEDDGDLDAEIVLRAKHAGTRGELWQKAEAISLGTEIILDDLARRIAGGASVIPYREAVKELEDHRKRLGRIDAVGNVVGWLLQIAFVGAALFAFRFWVWPWLKPMVASWFSG